MFAAMSHMKSGMLQLVASSAFVFGLSTIAMAQQAIGAKAGIIQYATGARELFLDGTPIQLSEINSIQMKNGQTLSTKRDWAELVLTPAAYLWLGENASLTMLKNDLNDIQVAINQGSAVLKINKTINACPINLHISKIIISIAKAGLYRFDANPDQLRVYGGEAFVKNGGMILPIRKGFMIHLDGKSAPEKFKAKPLDELCQFAVNRTSEIADWMNQSQKETEKALRKAKRKYEEFLEREERRKQGKQLPGDSTIWWLLPRS